MADSIKHGETDKTFGKEGNSLTDSFRHAADGILSSIRTERNLKIHFLMAIAVTVAGTCLKLRTYEWLICLMLFGLIISLELVNTALEAVVDMVTKEYRPLARKAKDAAAGAVLFSAIMAAIIGCIIFIPKLIDFL